MPPKPGRMTANPVRPARHRAGKPAGAVSSSDSDSDADAPPPAPRIPAPPKAASAGKIIKNLNEISISGRRQEPDRANQERRQAVRRLEKLAADQGFVTEDEDEGENEAGDDGEDEEEDEDEDRDREQENSEEEESSEEEAQRRLMLRPKFVPKSQRGQSATDVNQDQEATRQAAEAEKKKATDQLIEEQIKKDLAARAAGKKHWDDVDEKESDVDTTDGLDPEAEEVAWRVRELKRLKHARAAIEAREQELAEVERRRNLTAEERAAEDKAHLAKQREEKESRGKMSYMQKYYHRGAFFQHETREAGLLQRDIMGSRFQDEVRNREVLPDFLQRRDMTKLGRKGATRYKDMRSEDTGRWGQLADPRVTSRPNGIDRFRPDGDDRFRPDDAGPRGANAVPLADRKPPRDPSAPHESSGYPDGRDDRQYGPRGYNAGDAVLSQRRPPSRSPSPSRDDDGYQGRCKRSTQSDTDRFKYDKRRRVDHDAYRCR